MEFKPKARNSDLVVQEAGDEVLVYDLKTNKASCLNETSAAVWQLCDGNRSIVDISMELSAKFKANVSEDLVWLAFDQLQKENLLKPDENVIVSLDRVSRREIIKKVGIAAVIALPIISSVVAPQAAHAMSIAACSPTSSAVCFCGSGNPGVNTCLAAARAQFNDNCILVQDVSCNAGIACSTQGINAPPGVNCCYYDGSPSGVLGVDC